MADPFYRTIWAHMQLRRLIPVFLLAWLLIDFSDPTLPGVFSLEGQQLFVDGALTLGKTTPVRSGHTHRPLLCQRIDVRECFASADSTSRQPRPVPRVPRYPERRYLASSSDPSSSSADPH